MMAQDAVAKYLWHNVVLRTVVYQFGVNPNLVAEQEDSGLLRTVCLANCSAVLDCAILHKLVFHNSPIFLAPSYLVLYHGTLVNS